MRPVTACHVRRRRPIRFAHVAMRMFYALAGLAAFASIYARLLALLDDPVIAAMVTLMAVMAFTVLSAPAVRRP